MQDSTPAVSSSVEVEPEPPSKNRKLGFFFKKAWVDGHSSSQTCEERVEVQLVNYLKSQKADPLKWWQVHQQNNSMLCSLARKYCTENTVLVMCMCNKHTF